MMNRTVEDAVRTLHNCYNDARRGNFDAVVGADCRDYGHNPPGIGSAAARNYYDHAVPQTGGVPHYSIDE